MSDGNCLIRFLKESPIGLNARMMCMFSRHLLTKYANKAKGLKSAFLSPAWAKGRTCYNGKTKMYSYYMDE